MRRRESQDKAIEMRGAGKTYLEIATELEVNERTIRRWIGGLADERQRKESWPQDRIWPSDWTIDSLAILPGFERMIWESNLSLISTAEAQGNVHVPWFFRRLVELGREELIPDGSLDWGLAIAVLPVLGDWLGCSTACEELESAIREHRPWESPRAREGLRRKETSRGRYLRASRGSAEALRTALFTAQAQRTFTDMSVGTSTPAPILFAALHARTPLFDKPSGGLLYRRLKLGSIVLGLLAIAKKGESL